FIYSFFESIKVIFPSATVITTDPSTIASICAFTVSNARSVTLLIFLSTLSLHIRYLVIFLHQKTSSYINKKRFGYTSPLFLSISHCCWNWHSTLYVCCRGFKGPVPPPLWIRIHLLLICRYNYTSEYTKCQHLLLF